MQPNIQIHGQGHATLVSKAWQETRKMNVGFKFAPGQHLDELTSAKAMGLSFGTTCRDIP